MECDSIKVGFIFNHHHFLGGGEQSLISLIESLGGSAFTPVGIVPERGEISECLASRGIRSSLCPLSSLRVGTRGWFFRDLRTLMAAARQEGIKILHANGSRACFYGGLAGRLLGIPVLWHVRETIRDHLLYDGLLGGMANKIVCASQAIAQERFGRFGPILKSKVAVVRNGIAPDRLKRDEEKRSAIRAELAVKRDEVLIVQLGNFVSLKGHPFAIHGIAEALRLSPQLPVRLLGFGRILDVDYHRRLLALAREAGVRDRIAFHDYRTDVQGILSAADIFLLPSQREGFSRSLLEAMAMELPVIATQIPAIAEAVAGQGSLLVRDGDIGSLADAILKLSRDRGLRKEMGRINRERVLTQFTEELHRKAIESIYAQLLRPQG